MGCVRLTAIFLAVVLLGLPPDAARTVVRRAQSDPGARRQGERFPGLSGYDVVEHDGYLCRLATADLPLVLSTEEADDEAAVARAAEIWNRRGERLTGRPFFRLGDNGTPIRFRQPLQAYGDLGQTSFTERSDVLRVNSVALDASLTEEGAVPVLAHELGHVLGLDHSRDSRDLMFPRLAGSPAPEPANWLSPRDEAMLAWLYSQPEHETLRILGCWVRRSAAPQRLPVPGEQWLQQPAPVAGRSSR